MNTVVETPSAAPTDDAAPAPRKRNAERTRKAILTAALKEFSQAGYAGARIEKTGTASANPRNERAPSATSGNRSPISAAAAESIRICPSSAAPEIRDAKFTTLPIAV